MSSWTSRLNDDALLRESRADVALMVRSVSYGGGVKVVWRVAIWWCL